MAGRARVEYAGAVYHVLDRGDRREVILQRAEQWVIRGLLHLGLRQEDLCELPNGDVRKLAIAWGVRMQTTATNRRLAESLSIGYVSRLRGRALQQIEVQKLADRLEKTCEFTT